jgi:hypothetical protein
MPKIDAEAAQQFLDRQALIHARELDELRRTSMETKLQQLSSLMASRNLFAANPHREIEAAVVQQRWTQLWQAQGD